jgi:flagellar hook assembly protein FlgD
MYTSYPESIVKTHFFDFQLEKRTRVSIVVYDKMGKIVSNLVDSDLDAGEHGVVWHAVDNNGIPLSKGVYFYTMETDEFKATKTMSIAR